MRTSRTLADLLATARRRLAAAPFEADPREARLLLGHVLGLGEAQVLARDDQTVDDASRGRFEALLERRLRGEPVAYLLGEREFYGRPFFVDRRVLIPRPETEHLVEAALALELPAAPRILDVGSGSGCIAVVLALEIADARVVAGDLSLDVLEVLRSNVRRHGVGGRVRPLALDGTSAVRLDAFDLVVSNPPYVSPEDAALLSAEVRDFEPHVALFAPVSGQAVIAALLTAARRLRPGAFLLLEIGHDQHAWLRRAVPPWLELRDLIRDYSGHPRTAVLRRRSRSGASWTPGR